MPVVGSSDQNLVHIQKIGFLRKSFLDGHTLYFDNYSSESIHSCTIDTL